jgi:fatty-acyl-CoA synthase
MLGQMMQRPLLIADILKHAQTAFSDSEIISRVNDKSIHSQNFCDLAVRAAKLAHAIQMRGIKMGDRVATLAWNGHQHLELYYAISGMGAICHTINPRLPVESIAYIINHAEDKLLFIDPGFIPLIDEVLPHLDAPPQIVIMAAHNAEPTEFPAEMQIEHHHYEAMIEAMPDHFDWPEFDENTASGICYTSGTTGSPKGVLYSHRSTVLHAFQVGLSFSKALQEGARILPLVPLFHVNAWGLPFTCPLVGASMVFAGQHLDGPSLYDLITTQKVTSAWGVPTVLTTLLQEIESRGETPKSLTNILVGGSAVSASFITAYENLGISVNHAWGMTEMSPIGTQGNLPAKREGQNIGPEIIATKLRQGRKIFGIDMKIMDQNGAEIPQDGKLSGELYVRSNTTASQYYKNDEATAEAFHDKGWFRTGDIANIDRSGNLLITDRAKDLIKSGGEWISSLEHENIIMSHDDIAQCAVIAVPHEKWDERPVIVAVANSVQIDKDSMLTSKDSPHTEKLFGELVQMLSQHFPKWQMPDDLILLETLPLTATGKISKLKLRQKFKKKFGEII